MRIACAGILCVATAITITPPAHAQTPSSTYAVVVGVSQFDHPQSPRIALADEAANGFVRFLERAGVPRRNISTLVNRDATSLAISGELDRTLLKRAGPADTVYLFIAGRVLVETAAGAREAFLMGYDSDPGAKRTTAYRLENLRRALGQSRAGKVLLFVDVAGDNVDAELKGLVAARPLALSAVASGSVLAFAPGLAQMLTGPVEGGRDGSIRAGDVVAYFKRASGRTTVANSEPALALLAPPREQPAVAVAKPPDPVAPKPLPNFPAISSGPSAFRLVTSGRTYALVIGISRYASREIRPLNFAHRDAELFASLFSGVRDAGVTLLSNEAATTAAIRNGFARLRQAGPGDTVYLFIAAHATVVSTGSQAGGFIVTYDSDPDNLRDTALSMGEVQQLVQNDLADANRVFAFMDIDHAGVIGTVPGVSNRRINSLLDRLTEIKAKTELFLFLASRPNELSEEGPHFGGGHGAFTYFLANGLLGAGDVDRNGEVSIDELIEYTQSKVFDATFNRQRPRESGLYIGRGVLSRDPRLPVTQPPPPPSVSERNRLEADKWMTAARDAARNRRWDELLDALNKSIQFGVGMAGDAKDLLFASATTLVAEKDGANALKLLRAAERIDRNDPRLARPLRDAQVLVLTADAVTAREAKQWDVVVVKMQEIVKLIPQDKEAAERLAWAQCHLNHGAGVAAHARGSFAAAFGNLAEVLQYAKGITTVALRKEVEPLVVEAKEKMTSAQAELLYETGMEQFNRGNYKGAQAVFEQVLKIKPGHQPTLAQIMRLGSGDLERLNEAIRRGQEHALLGRWAEARDEFSFALRLNGKDTRAIQGRDRALAEIAGRQRLIWSASVGVGVPSLAALLVFSSPFRRARIYAGLGRHSRAAGVYEAILERNPGNTSAVLPLTRIYRRQGRVDRASEVCRGYLRMKPDDPVVLFEHGEIHVARGENKEALETFHQVLKAGGASPEIFARLLTIHGDPQFASGSTLKFYQLGARAGLVSPELDRLIALLMLQCGRRDFDATEAYLRALAHEPDNIAMRLAVADGLAREGRHREVIGMSREVLKRDPAQSAAAGTLLAASLKEGSVGDALAFLENAGMTPVAFLGACEDLVALDPPCRADVHASYVRVAGKLAPNAPELPVYQAHLALDEADLAGARYSLDRSDTPPDPRGPLAAERIRAYARLVERLQLEPGGAPPDLVFQVAEMQRASGRWKDALGHLRRIARLPEWELRSRTAMTEILDGLATGDLTAVFFESAGWTVRPVDADGASRYRDFLVDPPAAAETKLFSPFANAPVRCCLTPATLDDIVQLRRENAASDTHREFTFLAVPLRPRQDVFALIYALINEEPSLRIIPLETAYLKQSLLDGKSPELLEETLRLWVGQGDLFDVHSPISDASTFFGRGQFIHRINAKITQGENFGIFGLRKIGKTSLIFQLRETLPAHLIAYVDLQSISSRRCEEIYFRLAEALRREIRVKFPDSPLPAPRLNGFNPTQAYPTIGADFHNDLLLCRETLQRDGRGPQMLLLLDEIELMIPHGQSRGFDGYDDFFRQLRGLYQQEGFVLSGVVGADPSLCRSGRWGERDNPVFQYYDEVFLTPFESAECHHLVQGVGEVMGVTFEPAGVARVFEESGGHPYVARQLCSRVVCRFTKRPLRVTAEMVDEGVDDYIAQRPDYFHGVFRGYLSPEGRQILELVAETGDNRVSRADLLALAERKGFDRLSLERALQDLLLFQLLVRDGESYSMKILLMRRWIRRSWLGIE